MTKITISTNRSIGSYPPVIHRMRKGPAEVNSWHKVSLREASCVLSKFSSFSPLLPPLMKRREGKVARHPKTLQDRYGSRSIPDCARQLASGREQFPDISAPEPLSEKNEAFGLNGSFFSRHLQEVFHQSGNVFSMGTKRRCFDGKPVKTIKQVVPKLARHTEHRKRDIGSGEHMETGISRDGIADSLVSSVFEKTEKQRLYSRERSSSSSKKVLIRWRSPPILGCLPLHR